MEEEETKTPVVVTWVIIGFILMFFVLGMQNEIQKETSMLKYLTPVQMFFFIVMVANIIWVAFFSYFLFAFFVNGSRAFKRYLTLTELKTEPKQEYCSYEKVSGENDKISTRSEDETNG